MIDRIKALAKQYAPEFIEVRRHLHAHPELSYQEFETSKFVQQKLSEYKIPFEVKATTGVIGLIKGKNPESRIIALRADMDALPITEENNVSYKSLNEGVMHACGHDVHMASFIGAATIMAHSKDTWHGTLMLVGQPAEETISGARKMIDEGLMTRFPKPDVAIALHVINALPAGKVGTGSGYQSSNADSLRITIYGKGGHGSMPHSTIDPIVIAARTVVSLQTIVSREVKPGEIAVVTVGYIQAGTKNNIIPDQAELGLTVRTYKPDVRKQVLAAIERIAKAEAEAAGAPRAPQIERYEFTDSTYNEPGLDQRLAPVLERELGKDHVQVGEPILASEDFSYFTAQGIPSYYFWLGGADPQKYAEAKAGGAALPSNHSPLFAPVVDPSLHLGIAAEVAVLRDLLNASAQDLHKLAKPQPAN